MKINERNLSFCATVRPFDNEGWLEKRDEFNKIWQRRYIVLKGNLLFYFEKKCDKEPLGLIIVEGCTVELAEDIQQNAFQVVFNGTRSCVFSADSHAEMEMWMKSLTCAGYEYRRIMVDELQRQLIEVEATEKNLFLNYNVHDTKNFFFKNTSRRNPFNRVVNAAGKDYPSESTIISNSKSSIKAQSQQVLFCFRSVHDILAVQIREAIGD